MRRLRRLVFWSGAAAAVVALLLVGVFFFLERTERGQRIVLDLLLDRIEGVVDGDITIGGVRSRGLLGGVTLYDVRVEEPGGRPVLYADSVQATYDARTFLSGNVVLSSLVLWNAHLTVSRFPGEDDFNVDRLLRPDPRPPGSPPSTRRVVFHDVRLVNAFIEILQPVDPADPPSPRVATLELPGVEGLLQRMYFEDVHARIPEATILSPDVTGVRVEIESLSLVGYAFEDPFRLTQLAGVVTWADGRLVLDADEVSLPGSVASGRVIADLTPEARDGRETGWVVDLQLRSPRFTLEDLNWLLPDLPPEGTGEGSFDIRMTDLGDLRMGFSDAAVQLGDSRLVGEGTLLSNGVMTLQDVRVRAEPLALSTLEPYAPDLPLAGTLSGRATLNGTLDRLRAQGVVTLEEPGYAPTTADFSGTFHLDGAQGVTGLVARLDPLDYRLLAVFAPESPLGGSGTATVRATGSLDGEMLLDGDFTHVPGGDLPVSQVAFTGTVRRLAGELSLDLDTDVSPLSLTALRSYFPDLPVTGEVTGSIQMRGPLSDLVVSTDLDTPAGRLAVDARFDVGDPGAFYRVEGEVGDFVLSRLVAELPDPTIFTGDVRVEGRGTDPATATIDLRLRARRSRVGEIDVDTAFVQVRVRDGVFYVDDAAAFASGVALEARGTLAATEDGPAGELRLTFQADSLEALRPLLMGRDILVRDGLTALERELLRAEGIEPDTLPTGEEVALSGRLVGDVTLRGSLQRFSAQGRAQADQVRYGTTSVRSADLAFTVGGLPTFGESIQAHLVADTVEVQGRTFVHADVDLTFARPDGRVEVRLERNAREDYRFDARFALDSLGGRAEIDNLVLRLDTLTWALERTATVQWTEQSVLVSNLVLSRPDLPEEVRIVASGVLPRMGDADFILEVRGLRLEQVGQLLQMEAVEVGGQVDLDLNVRGTAELPLVTGTFQARDVRYEAYALERVEGDLDFRDRRIALDLEAWAGNLRVLHATGTIPAVIDLRQPSLGFPDEPIDLLVVADSLPAALVTGLFPDLLDVEGTVAGRFDIGGTLDNPAPSGRLLLQNAAWTLESLGVRHRNVEGTLDLRPDGTVEVDAVARADGTARLTGTVRLAPLSNPEFNLTASFNNFLAADRRDALANVTGVVTLTGAFDRPVVVSMAPGLRVNRGVLYLEEFVRAASVVDLTDPRFAEFVDPAILASSIFEESQNPFMQNLVVNVDMVVEQDTWLRSSEMNVEIAGRLAVSYDRAQMELVMRGELMAVRGSYTFLGRRFEVQQGRVEFIGLPGIDPDLDIVARTRIRRQSADALDVSARLTGRLTQPRVELSSEEVAVSQSDLVSYLLFGRPSYELASGERAVLEGTAGSFVGAGLGAVTSVFSGAVATRLGTVLAQQWGLDYFAITELGNVGVDPGSVTQTQVELGQYLSQDLFMVLAFQPVQVVGGNPFATFGVRVQYSPSDAYTLEGFWEDRYLRSRAVGFQDPASRNLKVLGLILFREWGY